MKRRVEQQIRVAIAIALAAGCASSFAGPVSEWRYIGEFQAKASTAGLATSNFSNAQGLSTRFDSRPWSSGADTSTGSALTLDAQTAAAVTDAGTAAADERRRALSSTASTSNTSPVVGTPAALQLTLWNFIASIRAQQVGNAFVQLQTSAANIDYTLNGVPAPVPLPPALWLFGAGLAALCGLRAATRAKPAATSAPALAAG